MLLEPKDVFEKLEFDKVIELVVRECLGALGQEAARSLKPIHAKERIERLLLEVSELKLSMTENDHFPLKVYEDIAEDLKMLAVENYVLSVEGLQRVNVTMRSVKNILKFFTNTRKEIYPHLFDIVREVNFDNELIKAIDAIIDEEGDIRPDASPTLQSIRRGINSKQQELEKVFRKLINEYRKNGWLSDSTESFRNGRRVLSVPSEHKRKIRGIIHDESSTGRTAFIEPDPVININNDIFDLENEEKREIFRLLKELSATLRPYCPVFAYYQELLIRFDLIRAKAAFAVKINGVMPKLKDGPSLGLINALHPLLYLKNLPLERPTIAFDLSLYGPNRVLVLSGPNAGGKSISMKTVGLCQLMLQSGLLISVDEQSEMGIFESVFTDIGDQQSLEDDLSTYSSRLKNMRLFLEKANKNSLILIDEFGSGTDPKIGGAIAEAILKELNQREVYGVITTHYSNLKLFAFKTRGIVNGAMNFNKENLSPTYEMKIGRPGSSFAFEIAEKSGLSRKVLKYAKHKTGANEKAIDELLIDLQREKKELEDKLAEMTNREAKLQKLIRSYDMMNKELEYKRKKMKLEAKEKNLQQAAQENKIMEKLVREIREEKNLEKAKENAAKIRAERKKLNDTVHGLREEIYYQPTTKEKNNQPIAPGDFVKLRTGGATGKVESISKNKAIVMMGLMKMTANIRDLQHANEPLDIKKTKGIQTNTVGNAAKFESKLDIRGLSKSEALKVLENFVDKALISSATHLNIVHGKGSGVLRDAVKSKLREYSDVGRIYHPEREFGGDGVTMVEFA